MHLGWTTPSLINSQTLGIVHTVTVTHATEVEPTPLLFFSLCSVADECHGKKKKKKKKNRERPGTLVA